MSRVIVFADVHAPYSHHQYLSFVRYTQLEYKNDTVVCGGDITDQMNLSRHQTETDAMGEREEFDLTIKELNKWVQHFPKLKMCQSNHDSIFQRQGATVGLGKRFVKSFNEVFGLPSTWEMAFTHEIDGVLYLHQGNANLMAYASVAGQSVVASHRHSQSGVKWQTNPKGKSIFALDTGSGADSDALAFKYGKHSVKKAVLSCGVIIDGKQAHVINMDMDFDYNGYMLFHEKQKEMK